MLIFILTGNSLLDRQEPVVVIELKFLTDDMLIATREIVA